MRTILYQAYGSEDIKNELLFSLVSLLPFASEDQYIIKIYTDDETYFKRPFLEDLRIYFEPLDEKRIKEWQGEDEFVHRLKIKVIQDFIEKGGTEGLYLDTDTVFTQSPKILFDGIHKGEYWMHESEGPLTPSKNKVFKKIATFVRNNTDNISHLPFAAEILGMKMFNAGLIGFDYRLGNEITKVLELNDGLYELFHKHIMEQLAFSLILAKNFKVKEGKSYVHHYWNLKEIRPLLKDFFEMYGDADTKTVIQKSRLINPLNLLNDKKRFIGRKRNRLLKVVGYGLKYQIPEFNELMRNA